MEENKLFEALLDVIPFAAYAVDIDSYEVVYANRLMSEGMFSPREIFCWKKLYGQEEVCSWCTIPELKQREKIYKSEKLISDFFDEASDKWLQTYDELVKWPDGRTVKYTIAVDITSQKEIQASIIKNNTKLAIQTKKLREANERLEFMATKDSLTQVNNRGNFFVLGNNLVEKIKIKKYKLYAAMFDLDKFKDINDKFGHKTGDVILKEFSNKVNSKINTNDIFGRLGGEEFALLIPVEYEGEIFKKLDNIRASVEQMEIEHNSEKIKLTVSIGFDEFRENDTLDTLLDRADKFLYDAKKSGRNRVKFRSG